MSVSTLYLVHHGEALAAEIDPQRPLSRSGHAAAEDLARRAAARGVRPAAIWHSGKLRAKQTAEAFWKACNPLATVTACRGLQPDDPPEWIRDELLAATEDVLVAGHFPHLGRLLGLLTRGVSHQASADFPQHGVVALERAGDRWVERWRDR